MDRDNDFFHDTITHEKWKSKVEFQIETALKQLTEITNKVDHIANKLSDKVDDHRVAISQLPQISNRVDSLERELKEHVREFSSQKGKLSVWILVLTLVLTGVFGYFFSTMKGPSAPQVKVRAK